MLTRREWSWKNLAIIFSICTVYLLMMLVQTYFHYGWSNSPPPSWLAEIADVSVWSYTWALLTPVIFILSKRFPISRKHIIRNVSYHLFFGIIFVTIHRIIFLSYAGFLLKQEINVGQTFIAQLYFILHHISDGLFTYIFILAIHQAAMYFRESQDRQFRLQQAELKALKMQLHPHFLFNTLNAISALVFVSPQDATRTIAQLSDLLRLTLSSGKAQEVTLKEELDFLRKYVQIQQTLLQERLEVCWEIAPETLDAAIPNMLLQPLVENSIRHGIAPKEEGGRIEICSWREGKNLRLEIEDNGLGFSSGVQKNGSGIGLENTRMRLKYLYKDAHEINLVESPVGGLTVSLTIPFREQISENSEEFSAKQILQKQK